MLHADLPSHPQLVDAMRAGLAIACRESLVAAAYSVRRDRLPPAKAGPVARWIWTTWTSWQCYVSLSWHCQRAITMRSVFLDYDTVSFNDDLTPATLAGIAPDLSLRPHTAQESVAETIDGAAIVLVNKLRLDRAAMERTPTLKLIALAATGTNNVDLGGRAGTGHRRLQRARLLHRVGRAARPWRHAAAHAQAS